MRSLRFILSLIALLFSVSMFAQQASSNGAQRRYLQRLYESSVSQLHPYSGEQALIVPRSYSVQWEQAYTAEKEQQLFCEVPIRSARGLYALRSDQSGSYEVRVSQRLVVIEFLDRLEDGRTIYVPYIRSIIPDRVCDSDNIDTLYNHLSTNNFSGIECYSDLAGCLITISRYYKGKQRESIFVAGRKALQSDLNEILRRATLYSYSDTMSVTHNTPKKLNGRLVYSGDLSSTSVAYDLERCPICCKYISDENSSADKICSGDHLLLEISPSESATYGSVVSRKVADGTLIIGSQPTSHHYNDDFITAAELQNAKCRHVSLDSLCQAYADRPMRPMFDSIMARHRGNVFLIRRAKRSPTQKEITYLIESLTHFTLVSADATFGTPITADALMAKIEQGRCFVLDSRKATYFRPYFRFLSKDRVAIHRVYRCSDMFHQSVDRSLSDSTYIANGNYINDAYIVPRATFDLNDPRVVDLDKFSSENDYIAINALLDPRGRWMERYNAARYIYKGSGDDPVYLIDRAEMNDSTIVVRQVQIIKSGGVDDRRTKDDPQAGIIVDDEILYIDAE